MVIQSSYKHRNIIYHGNSLMNLASGSNTVSNGHYLSNKIHTSLIASKNYLSAVFLSINGNPCATKIANWSTQTLPVIKENDIVILWEIQNDVNAGGLTGAQAYANYVTMAGLVHGVGAKIVAVTATPRDVVGDTDQNTRNLACNALIMADNTNFDLKIDMTTNAAFDAQADASNATYYLSDKLHFTTAGQDLAASIISTALLSSSIL